MTDKPTTITAPRCGVYPPVFDRVDGKPQTPCLRPAGHLAFARDVWIADYGLTDPSDPSSMGGVNMPPIWHYDGDGTTWSDPLDIPTPTDLPALPDLIAALGNDPEQELRRQEHAQHARRRRLRGERYRLIMSFWIGLCLGLMAGHAGLLLWLA